MLKKVHKQIIEIESDLKALIKKADSIDPTFGRIPNAAITSFQDGLCWIERCHLGELKNAFDLQDADIKKINEEMKKHKSE